MNKTITTEKVVEAVKLLKGMKLVDMDDDSLVKVWRNLSNMRSTADKYEADIKDIGDSLQDDAFRKWEHRLTVAKEKEDKANKKEYELTPEDKEETQQIIAFYDDYNRKINLRMEDLKKTEVNVDIEEIQSKEFLKGIKKNDLAMGELLKLDFMLSDNA